MKRDTTKRFYIIHSWVGILTAVLMFVVCFTGAISVFGRPELQIWSNTDVRAADPIKPEVLEKLIRDHAKTIPSEYLDEIFVQLPGVRRATDLLITFEAHKYDDEGREEHHFIRFDHHPKTLELKLKKEGSVEEVFNTDRTDMADFLITFHADLHLGNPIGLLITGLLGLTLFASIVTGVVIHRKILREAFKFRPWRSLRLLFTDSHKALGVWGLLFHASIAFTGAFLGLAVVLLLKAAAFVSFSGDMDKLVDTFLPTNEPEKSGIYSEIHVANVLNKVNLNGDGDAFLITILGGEDKNAVVLINSTPGSDVTGKVQRYSAVEAELLEEYTVYSRVGGIAGPMLDAMFPLHFGNFGGLGIKFLWFALGMSTAFLSITGAMIWIERRCYGPEGKLTEKTYDLIARFSSGACAGLVLAVAALFHAQLLFKVSAENSGFWLSSIFFGVWIASVIYSWIRKSSYRIVKELLLLSGAAYVLVAPVNALVTGYHIFNVFQLGHWITAGVDLTVLILGLATFFLALKLPDSRPAENKKIEKNKSDFSIPDSSEVEPV